MTQRGQFRMTFDSWGCPRMQGYYFARPLGADDLELLLRGTRTLGSRAPAARTAA